MPFCKECGSEVPEGAAYCPKCGTKVGYKYPFVLASWGDRVIAYIIDVFIVGIISSIIFPFSMGMGMNWAVPFINLGGRSVLYFLYWTVIEGMYGQSLGKMVMKIEVIDINGGPIDYGKSAIQAVGKAFLLPLDLILGWFLSSELEQRFFNMISDTIVVKMKN